MADQTTREDVLANFANMFAMKAFTDRSGAFGRRMTQIALDAAGQSFRLSADWTQEVIAELRRMSDLKGTDKQSVELMQNFGRKQIEATVKYMEALDEIARQVQTATLELTMEYGKAMGENAEQVSRAAVKSAREAGQTRE